MFIYLTLVFVNNVSRAFRNNTVHAKLVQNSALTLCVRLLSFQIAFRILVHWSLEEPPQTEWSPYAPDDTATLKLLQFVLLWFQIQICFILTSCECKIVVKFQSANM